MWKFLSYILLVVSFLGSMQFVYLVFSNKASPYDRGPTNGQLRPCGSFNNCVSSMANGTQFVLPIKTGPNLRKASAHLRDAIEAGGGKIQRISEVKYTVDDPETGEPKEMTVWYLWATFSSDLIGFVDDVEVVLDRDYGEFHIRSESRVGYFDFGVNRARVDEIRALYQLFQD